MHAVELASIPVTRLQLPAGTFTVRALGPDAPGASPAGDTGGGVPVLLLMGLGGRGRDWGPWFPAALAQRHRVLVLDNRGTGGSASPEGDWSLEDMAEDARHALDALGIERAHVVGLSMGGMLAQLLALAHPERVARVGLISTHAGGPIVPRSPAVLEAFMPARGTPPEVILRTAMRLIAAPGFEVAHPERIEALVRIGLEEQTSKRAFSKQFQAVLSGDRSAALPGFTRPTLVVHGDQDALIAHEEGERLARLIPGARLHTLVGCGHLPMWEQPEALAAVVGEFLAS